MDPRLTQALEGRYTIAHEIGVGGMATVYLAHDLRHDRDVALKVLKPELGAVLGVDRFLSEIKTTAKLQHPHILPLLDSGDAAGLLFYVMPYVEGESLRARLDRERQLPIPDAVRIAREVAGALDYAHRHGVVHRDIKPENILLHDGQALVADFGIALAVQSAGGQRMTQTGLSLGTPQYMSPEQAMGEKAVDARSDIYALGAVTYEMLAGDPPFTGSSVQAIVARVLNEHPTPLRTLRDTVPPLLDRAVSTSLAKLAADRFASAKEFADALDATGAPAIQEHADQPPAARGRLRDPVVVGLAALLLITAAFAGLQWSRGRSTAVAETVRFAINLPRYVSVGLPIGSGVSISQDGRTIAYIGGSSDGSAQQLFVRTVTDLNPRPLRGTEAAQSVFASPDGRAVGFWAKGRLAVISVEGGEPRQIAEVAGAATLVRGYAGASWSSRGVIVASINGQIATAPDTGGEFVRVVPPVPTRVPQVERTPVILGDGSTVLYVTSDSGGPPRTTIAAASLADGRRSLLGLPGLMPLGIVDNTLVYVTALGQIMAVPFDLSGLRITGAPRQVETLVAAERPSAALSANGTLVLRGGSRVAEMVLVGRNGAVRPALAEPQPYAFPRFSPDGKRVAYVVEAEGRRHIWVRDLGAQTAVRITDEADAERPEWSPDGKWILYRGAGPGVTSAIWRRPVDMTVRAELVFPDARTGLWEAVPTPDGKGLVMQRDDTGATGADLVYRALSPDSTLRNLLASPFEETQPRVSPDGKWVAFHTNASGGSQVAVMRLAGGGSVVVSNGPGSEPVWSRDGRHLYYRDGTQLVEVTYSASPEFAVTSRRPMFADVYLFAAAPHANYDLSPDGETFLFLKPTEGQMLTVAYNWRAELRRLMGAQERR